MAAQETKPNLFSFYGNEYRYDDLASIADHGLNDYISGLKRGNKDNVHFLDAYNNIMAGIKNGTMRFQDGHFVDTTGKYFNYYGASEKDKKDKNKDYYGLMAKYIYDLMYGNRDNKYTTPVDTSKVKFGNTSVGKAYAKFATGQDTIDDALLRGYIDRDEYDETTGKRALTKRYGNVKEFIDLMNTDEGWDRLMTGYEYTTDQRDAWRRDARAALDAVSDGLMTEGDLAAIMKSLYGNNYERMFYTGKGYGSETTSAAQQASLGAADATDDEASTRLAAYRLYLDAAFPNHTLTPKSYAIERMTTPYFERLSSYFKEMKPEDLRSGLLSFLRDPSKTFAGGDGLGEAANKNMLYAYLTYMKNNNMLDEYALGDSNPGVYYIPDSWDSSSGSIAGTVWDSNNNSVYDTSIFNIPLVVKLIQDAFNNWYSSQLGSHWSDLYSRLYEGFKKGGVLKALHGIDLPPLPNNDPWQTLGSMASTSPIGDYAKEWVFKNYGTREDYNDELSKYYLLNEILPGWDENKKRTARDKSNIGDPTPSLENAYRLHRLYADSGNMVTDVRTAYANWKKDNPNLTDEDFIKWYNGGVDIMRDLSRLKFSKGYNDTTYLPLFDWHTKLYSSLALNREDGKNIGALENIGHILAASNFLRNPLAFGTDDDFADKRLGLFSDDEGANLFWIDNDGHLVIKPKEAVTPEERVTPDGEDGAKLSRITLEDGDKKSSGLLKFFQGAGSFLGDISPDLIGAGRLAYSIGTNNRITKTIDKSLKPVLEDTYERYSPVTGALSAMNYLNSQGNLVMLKSSDPWVSDMEKTAARLFEAQRQKNELDLKGFMIDDNEIKRTKAEALLRLEDNLARRTATAMTNRKSINLVFREKAQLEATRLQRNWQSIDNFLQGIEGRWRNKLDERNQLRYDANTRAITTKYADAVARLDAMYEEKHQGATASLKLRDPKYTAALKAILKLYEYETYLLPTLFNYRLDPYEGYSNKSYDEILGKLSLRRGGILKPTTMLLINKVIKNENNT